MQMADNCARGLNSDLNLSASSSRWFEQDGIRLRVLVIVTSDLPPYNCLYSSGTETCEFQTFAGSCPGAVSDLDGGMT